MGEIMVFRELLMYLLLIIVDFVESKGKINDRA